MIKGLVGYDTEEEGKVETCKNKGAKDTAFVSKETRLRSNQYCELH